MSDKNEAKAAEPVKITTHRATITFTPHPKPEAEVKSEAKKED